MMRRKKRSHFSPEMFSPTRKLIYYTKHHKDIFDNVIVKSAQEKFKRQENDQDHFLPRDNILHSIPPVTKFVNSPLFGVYRVRKSSFGNHQSNVRKIYKIESIQKYQEKNEEINNYEDETNLVEIHLKRPSRTSQRQKENNISRTRKLIDYTKQRKDIMDHVVVKSDQEIFEREKIMNQGHFLPRDNVLHSIPTEIKFENSSLSDVYRFRKLSFRHKSNKRKKYDMESIQEYQVKYDEKKRDENENNLVDFYLKIPSRTSRRQKQNTISRIAFREQILRRNLPATRNRKSIIESIINRKIIEDNW